MSSSDEDSAGSAYDFTLVGPENLLLLFANTRRLLCCLGLPERAVTTTCHFHFCVRPLQLAQAIHRCVRKCKAAALRSLLTGLAPHIAKEVCSSRVRQDVGTPLINLLFDLRYRDGALHRVASGDGDSDSNSEDIEKGTCLKGSKNPSLSDMESCVKLLVEFGADIDAPVILCNEADGNSDSSQNMAEMVHFILPPGFTPVIFAAINGLTSVLRIMLMSRASSSAPLALLLCCIFRFKKLLEKEPLTTKDEGDGSSEDEDWFADHTVRDADSLVGVVKEMLTLGVSPDLEMAVPTNWKRTLLYFRSVQATIFVPALTDGVRLGVYRTGALHLALLSGDAELAAILQEAAPKDLTDWELLGTTGADGDDSSEEGEMDNFTLIDDNGLFNPGGIRYSMPTDGSLDNTYAAISMEDLVEQVVDRLSSSRAEKVQRVLGTLTRVVVVTLDASVSEGQKLAVHCSGIGGDEIASLTVPHEMQLRAFKVRLAECLKVCVSQLRLMLADGHLVTPASDSELLSVLFGVVPGASESGGYLT